MILYATGRDGSRMYAKLKEELEKYFFLLLNPFATDLFMPKSKIETISSAYLRLIPHVGVPPPHHLLFRF